MEVEPQAIGGRNGSYPTLILNIRQEDKEMIRATWRHVEVM